jgi:hypothetical protein
MSYFKNLEDLSKKVSVLSKEANEANNRLQKASSELTNEKNAKIQKSVKAVLHEIISNFQGDWCFTDPGARLKNQIFAFSVKDEDNDTILIKKIDVNVSTKTFVISSKVTDVNSISITRMQKISESFCKSGNWYFSPYDIATKGESKNFDEDQKQAIHVGNYTLQSYLQKRFK